MFAPEHVLEVLQQLDEREARTHAVHSAGEIVLLTDFAIKHGASKAERISKFTFLCLKIHFLCLTTFLCEDSFVLFVGFWSWLIRPLRREKFLFGIELR